MPKSTEEVLTGLLSTSYKLDEGSLSELKEADGSWKDDALDVLTRKDQERVTALKGDVEKQLGERYSRGKREALEALEKQLRDEFGIKETNVQGVDLVKSIVAAKAKALETLPDEKVKAHPLYLQLEEQARNFPTTLEQKVKEAQEALQTVLPSPRPRTSSGASTRSSPRTRRSQRPRNRSSICRSPSTSSSTWRMRRAMSPISSP
jgi:hypothetical protein